MVRTRFAPSPTGFLHIGGLRTALYNYLFARKQKGTFILRIEDTDQKRYVEGAIESLLKTLQQVDLEYDEGPKRNGKFGPYIQSQRTDMYRKYAQELVDKKAAYPCFCTAERLEEMRKKQTERKEAPMYDRTCMNLSEQEIDSKKSESIPFVIRQKIPHGKFLKFADLIRGKVSFETSTIDDQVLMKSDNFPTYHLANVIDDHLMEITHVIRGEEWLPSTPKHILLYEAFGWEKPEFAHIPLLLNKDRTKLSKRQGDVSVEDYLAKGYIKEALINFIALLGWHPGKGTEEEIFSIADLIEKFSLENVHKAGAIFDLEKLNWFNFQWKKRLHSQKLSELAKKIAPEVNITSDERGHISYSFSDKESTNEFEKKRGEILLEMCKKSLPEDIIKKSFLNRALITFEEKILKNPGELHDQISFYNKPKEFSKSLLINEKMKVDESIAQKSLSESIKFLASLPEESFEDVQGLQKELVGLAQKLELKNGQLLWPLRVALSGEQFSPGVFEIIWVLGKDESVKRMKNTLENQFKTAA